MYKVFREPLVHFLIIGVMLFLVFELFNDPAGPESSRIVITQGRIDFIKASFERTRQRQPTTQELNGLMESFVREEVLYREALALGLDKNDTIIRRRLNQKLELMSDDLAAIATPSDKQLQDFMVARPEMFRIEPRIAFRHIYFDVSQRGFKAEAEAEKLLSVLSSGQGRLKLETLGDSLPLPQEFVLTPTSDLTRLFGETFSREIGAVTPPGTWAGPIKSGYGIHLVMVTDFVAGRQPQLDEVRDKVEWEWASVNRKELKENLYQELRGKYTVSVEQPDGKVEPFQDTQPATASQGMSQ